MGALLTACSHRNSIDRESTNQIIFPRPFAFAIDDMGWNIGNDAGDVDHQGPYRIGIDRRMGIDDYRGIVEVGKQVGVRIQGLFVLAEMDRENILAKYPTTTWQGKNWNNSGNVNQEQIDIMNFVKQNAANLEFGLHGVGHEYWLDGKKKRAEWYCTDDNHPWPEASMEEHIQCFKDIMAQYNLSPEYGQSFPESFVPCAYGYFWNPEGDYSTGEVMAGAGVKYVNTLFDYIRELNPPAEPNGGGFDHGVIVVNRINYGNDWYKLSSLPTVDLNEQESDIIESHWSNWLAQDQFLQEKTNQEWVDYYRMVQSSADRYVAKNTEQFFSQWLYKKYTTVTQTGEGLVSIDNSAMPADAYQNDILGNMVLKIRLDSAEHISEARLDGNRIPCYFEEEGYGFMYLPVLNQKSYQLTYTTGKMNPGSYIFNKGTYNVYSYLVKPESVMATIRMYGTQDVDFFGVENPADIQISNMNIQLLNSEYSLQNKHLVLTLHAVDMQGETGDILLTFK